MKREIKRNPRIHPATPRETPPQPPAQPPRQTQRRNGNGTATAQRQPDNVTCVWRRIIITFNTTTTFTTTSNRNSMVAGKSGLQANQTRSKHLACQGVAGKSGLQANQRRPGVLQPPIPSKNPSGGAGLAHPGPGRRPGREKKASCFTI